MDPNSRPECSENRRRGDLLLPAASFEEDRHPRPSDVYGAVPVCGGFCHAGHRCLCRFRTGPAPSENPEPDLRPCAGAEEPSLSAGGIQLYDLSAAVAGSHRLREAACHEPPRAQGERAGGGGGDDADSIAPGRVFPAVFIRRPGRPHGLHQLPVQHARGFVPDDGTHLHLFSDVCYTDGGIRPGAGAARFCCHYLHGAAVFVDDAGADQDLGAADGAVCKGGRS